MSQQACTLWAVRRFSNAKRLVELILVVIAYQTTLTFWTAAFPGLARNTPQLRVKAEEYAAGAITRDEYDYVDTLQRSRLSNMAFYIQSCGEIVILVMIVGVLFGVHVQDSEANNNYGLSVLIAFATGVWLLLAMPWFILEKRRPGQPLPPNMNIVYGRLLATLPSPDPDLAPETEPALPDRLLPTWRLAQHHRDRHRHFTKQCSGV